VRARARTGALVLLAAAAVAVAGCGGDDKGTPIPSATANALNAELDNVQARLDNGSAGACRDILEGSRGPNLERVNQLIDQIPNDVDPDVRAALEQSFDRLWDLVGQDCDEKAKREQGRQEQQPQETTPTETTPTETTPTETTPTETTPTQTTPPSQEPLPPEGDGNNGGGVPGNGNGNSGGGVGTDGTLQENGE
jgi:cell division septation protein DedD